MVPKDKVARFCSTDGSFESFLVTHFADENDVGIFADQCTQRFIEVQTVNADFALIDACLLILEYVLNGIFDGDDVDPSTHVHVLEHGRNRCRFS